MSLRVVICAARSEDHHRIVRAGCHHIVHDPGMRKNNICWDCMTTGQTFFTLIRKRLQSGLQNFGNGLKNSKIFEWFEWIIFNLDFFQNCYIIFIGPSGYLSTVTICWLLKILNHSPLYTIVFKSFFNLVIEKLKNKHNLGAEYNG